MVAPHRRMAPAAPKPTDVTTPASAPPRIVADATGTRVHAHASDSLAGVLARSVQERAVNAAASGPTLLQRTISVGDDDFTAGTLADALKADEDVVWHDEYLPELAILDAQNRKFADHGALMMWLAGAHMAAKKAAATPAAAAATPKPKGAAPAALTPPLVTLGELAKAAPVGGTAGQRYDKQGATHTSVTFKMAGHGVVRIVGLHRTLSSGSHIYWAKDTGGGKFALSSSSGTPIESIKRSPALENAWKAVAKVARKLRCDALEPVWE